MSIFRQSAIKATMRIASADLGCHEHFMEATKSATDTFRQNGTGRLLAMLADLALTKHASGSFEQQLYHKLSRQEHWTPQMDEMVEPVAEFLAMNKEAGIWDTVKGWFGGASTSPIQDAIFKPLHMVRPREQNSPARTSNMAANATSADIFGLRAMADAGVNLEEHRYSPNTLHLTADTMPHPTIKKIPDMTPTLAKPVVTPIRLTKSSNVGAAVAPAKIMQTLGGGASKGSEGLLGLFTTAMLASTALGSGMGALNWHMKRQVNEDDAGNEEMSAKADFMRDMAEQIRRDARLRKWRGAATSGA